MKRAKVYPPRPASPRDCLRSHVAGTCDTCGVGVERLHTPLRGPGMFCAACCPCCTPAPRPLGPLKWAPDIDHDAPEARARD